MSALDSVQFNCKVFNKRTQRNSTRLPTLRETIFVKMNSCATLTSFASFINVKCYLFESYSDCVSYRNFTKTYRYWIMTINKHRYTKRTLKCSPAIILEMRRGGLQSHYNKITLPMGRGRCNCL